MATNQNGSRLTAEEIRRPDPGCECCRGTGVAISPVDGWHSTDRQLREPCACLEIPEDTQMTSRVRLTPEDEAIFDRRHDSMDAQWAYEDAQERDYEQMLWIMRARERFDLASPVVRIAVMVAECGSSPDPDSQLQEARGEL